MARPAAATKQTETADHNRVRMTVIASPEQADIITRTAKDEGQDRSAWILAHAMKATQIKGKAAPVVLVGPQAEKVRALAGRQGLTPEKLIEQWLIAAG